MNLQQLNKGDVLLGIIIILIIFNIINTNGVKTDVKSYKTKIESLEKKLDSAKVVDKKITTKIDSVNNKVVVITKEIENIDNKITIVKNQTDEKVNNIDKLSNAELELFFTSRYNKNNSTK